MERESLGELLEERAGDGDAPSDLEAQVDSLQAELGHGHPEVLVLEEQLAHKYLRDGRVACARGRLEEVLVYRAVVDGEHGIPTARVARDLFRLLSQEGDRPAMAEVYYRFLSWIPMRDSSTLAPELRAILGDVEAILAESC